MEEAVAEAFGFGAGEIAVEGDEATRRRAYLQAFVALRRRVELLVALPVEKLDRLALETQARAIAEATR